MIDIFISYAREDRPRAELLANAFEAKGWSVFWDRNIPSGQTWRSFVGKALDEAHCIIVAWSNNSLDSHWVHEEAEEGRVRQVLIPVLFDNIMPPIGFRSVQASDLADWDGSPDSDPFKQLLKDIATQLGYPQELKEEKRLKEKAKIKKHEKQINEKVKTSRIEAEKKEESKQASKVVEEVLEYKFETAIPAFVGYTEKAVMDGKSLINKPTRITSLIEFHQYFGEAPRTMFVIDADETNVFRISTEHGTRFNLYRSILLFFANGGSTCYIVSVGIYGSGVSYNDLNDEGTESGIQTLQRFPEPTMLVIPDAVLLEPVDCSQLQQAMLMHCSMNCRIAILDVCNGDQYRTYDDMDVVVRSREGIGNNFLDWGASYYPYLITTVVQEDEVDFSNISNLDSLIHLLNEDADMHYSGDAALLVKDDIIKLSWPEDDSLNLHRTLLIKSPLYKTILAELRDNLNVLPPSGGIAGVLVRNDRDFGVYHAPTNILMESVVDPIFNITNKEQEDMDVPLSGKAINPIRSFPGKGTLVWGARTLDGHNQDFRFLNVKRTIIMIEQFLKISSEPYKFERNEVKTWVAIKEMMKKYLLYQWEQGVLVGKAPEEAFCVDIGLGTTMTPLDVENGIMRVTVKLAVLKPNEFVESSWLIQ